MSIQNKKGIPKNRSRDKIKNKIFNHSTRLNSRVHAGKQLATMHGLDNSINVVQLQPATKRKTVNVKFQVKKMNRRPNKNENGVGNEIFTTTVDAHEKGVGNEIFTTTVDAQGDTGNEIFTTTVDAQGDTGANCSATNMIDIIHNYRRFEVPQDIGVFSGDESSTTLQALGEGVIKILSDQGSIMEWTVLYTPLSSGTVLSPDNYHSTHEQLIKAGSRWIHVLILKYITLDGQTLCPRTDCFCFDASF
jgi:hypothetical protein